MIYEIKKMKDLKDPEKLEFFKSFYYTHTLQETLQYCNIGETSLYRQLNTFNIPRKETIKPVKLKPTPEEFEEYYANHTMIEALQHFNLTRGELNGFIAKNNIKKTKICLDEQAVCDYIKSHSVTECARHFNRSTSMIYKILEKYNIKVASANVLKLDIEEFTKFYITEKHSRKETCEQFNISPAQLAKIARDNQIKKEKTNYKNIQAIITKEALNQYYVVEDHSIEETYQYFNKQVKILPGVIPTLIKKYNIDKLNYSKQLIVQYVTEHPKCTLHEIEQNLPVCYAQVCHLANKLGLLDQLTLTPTISSYEIEIAQFLDSLNISYITNTRTVLKNGLELDIYVPDKQVAIEFNGAWWHSSVYKEKNYHLDKAKAAQAQGIRLIQIQDYEWDDPDKQAKIKLLLQNALTNNNQKIYARKCTAKEISNSEAEAFNIQYHLQNHRNAQITIGLYYEEQLVQLMSFSKSKYNKNLRVDNSWEIIRGCTKADINVVGGVSKILKYFVQQYKPEVIFSYCDFNKFNGKSYMNAGLTFIGYTGPDLKYLLQNGKVVNRNPREYNKNKDQTKLQGAGSLKFEINYKSS